MKEAIKSFAIKYKTPLIIAGVLLLIVIIWWMSNKAGSSDGSATSIARCLKNKGAKFYGASWCPHCNHQKDTFGNAASLLPYVECSNPDRTQTQQCIDAGVKAYPTWVFPGGKTQSGEMTLQQLKDAVGC